MNNEKWETLLEKTSGFGNQEPTFILEENHLGITFNFFRSLEIDDENKTFLDIGCSDGKTALVKAKWTGIDMFGNFVVGDAHELPFEDDSYDIIFCSHTLEHTLSPFLCLLEIERALKEDGDVIIGVPCDPGFFSTDHHYILTEKGWGHLIQQAGLKIIKTSEKQKDCIAFHCKK